MKLISSSPLENTDIALQVTFVFLPSVLPLCHSFSPVLYPWMPSSNVNIAAGRREELFTAAGITVVPAGRGGQLARNVLLLSARAWQA